VFHTPTFSDVALSSEEDGSKHFLVDFEQKTLIAQAERRRAQQQSADQNRTDQREHNEQDQHKDDEMPNNPDDQWSVSTAISACFQQNY